ncbi:MAG: glycolate oxidase, partial [Candidatus Eisenbacteria bacterium]|nr:glycolate oxidase [Candidatus Eisenbacteria bacterium]
LALRAVRAAARSGLATLIVRLFFANSVRTHFRLLIESLRAEPAAEAPAPALPRPGGAGAASGEQVAIFRGCTTPVLFPEVMQAFERCLARLDLAVADPSSQVCCGALLLHHGDIESARRLARRNIEAFEAHDGVILVEAAGCGAALKGYGDLLADDERYAARARRFAARVRDVGEYLAARLPAPHEAAAASMPAREMGDAAPLLVTYQDPCHLRHVQGVAAAPRRLIDALRGVRRADAGEADLCCGSAGIYNLLEPEMSQRLAERKVVQLAATGAQCVITANPGCRIQLAGRLQREGIAMQHLVELWAARGAAAAASEAEPRRPGE